MPAKPKQTSSYSHPEADALMRPEVGTQAQFPNRKRKLPQRYRYDSSLAPELNWDGQNGARELGEWLLDVISRYANGDANPQEFKSADGVTLYRVYNIQQAVDLLRTLSQPFLNWSGKAERLSFDVPTLPLFVHERLSTQAIIETLKGHKRNKQLSFFDLFADPQHSIADQVLRAYEYKDNWTNRMILGDSLTVMNSLLQYESLGGQVQMIYMDPPYGVKFGSNFQPFVRKRDVKNNDDADLTREPEMVKAYRDTWELGLHSYLTYLRDRLLLARELLTESGSIFVQISDENVHHVRELMDEVFGAENFCGLIPFRKKTMPLGAKYLESICDYIIWYAKDNEWLRFNRLYTQMNIEGDSHWNYVELPDGTRRRMTEQEINNHSSLPKGSIPFRLMSLYPVGINKTGLFSFEFRGKIYSPPDGNSWFTNPDGMQNIIKANRIEPYEDGTTLGYVLKLSDGPVSQLTNLWSDTSAPRDKKYVFQTDKQIIQRCMLMSTNPGDLVLDPTCGGGTTAMVAEEWGRRWITIDVSRVPLALARQRLLSKTYKYYKLQDENRGPAGGFQYKYTEDARGLQSGGIIRSITRGTISNNEIASEIILVDCPETDSKLTRVSGTFVFEATIPTPVNLEEDDTTSPEREAYGSFVERMIETLRRSPVLALGGGRTVTLRGVRPPAKSLSLSAEATIESGQIFIPIAIVFGPENGAVSEKLVYEAAREARAKDYRHLYIIGFAIEAKARQLVEDCESVTGIPAAYVQATPDLLMGDLLKNMRSSQIFSVCGLPEVTLRRRETDGQTFYQVELLGLDVFDPVTMENEHRRGDDVPAWFLDTAYDGLVFHVGQAFFPRTAAWENLKKALKGEYEEGVWEHLAGAVSAPFEAEPTAQIAVKVIDDRGNELLVVKAVAEAIGI